MTTTIAMRCWRDSRAHQNVILNRRADATERLIEAVISGSFKSVADIAKLAKDALGADKVKPTPA